MPGIESTELPPALAPVLEPRPPEEFDVLATREAGGAAVRGGALRVIGYLVIALLGAGSAAVLFRQIGVASTGRYVTVLSLINIVAGITDLGLTALGLRELSLRDAAGRDALLRTLLGLRIALTGVGIGFAVVFCLVAGYRPVVVAGVAVAGVGLLLFGLQSTVALILMRDLRLGWVTAFEVLRSLIQAALVIALAVAGAGVLPALGAAAPAGIVVFLATVPLLRGRVSLRPSFDRRQWWALLRDVLPYSLAVATAAVYFRVSVVVVSLVATAEQLGYFSASFRILEVLLAIPALIAAAAFPIFAHSAREDRERFAYAVERVFEVSAIVGVWFAVVLALGAPIAIDVVGGQHFEPAINILRIQGIGLGASFVTAVWGTALLSLHRHRDALVLNLGALIVGAVVVTIASLVDGTHGAAIATAVTELGLATAGGVLLSRAHPELHPSLRSLPRVLLAGGLAAAVGLLPGVPAVGLVALSTLVYVAALFTLRSVPAEITYELRRLRVIVAERG